MNDNETKCYAIVPAAGRSMRMGRPKLMLPWPTDQMPDGLLIDKVLSAWTSSRVSEVVVVVRSDDEPLRRACEGWPVTIVHPTEPPADMKASVQAGLRYLQNHRHPRSNDRCFVAPADLPTLSSHCIDRLIESEFLPDTVVVPQFGGKRSHPARLPWTMTGEIFDLDDTEGVNAVVDRHLQMLVEFPADQAVEDIDTPQEYRKAIESAARRRS